MSQEQQDYIPPINVNLLFNPIITNDQVQHTGQEEMNQWHPPLTYQPQFINQNAFWHVLGG